MKQLVFFLFITFGFKSLGQSPYIVSIDIIPQNPTTNDEVFLATHVGTGNLGQYLGSTVSVSGNNVTVESCYFEGWLTQPQEYFDTISIGYLGSGNFNLSYTGYVSWDNLNCDYQLSNNQDTTFFVEQFVSLDETAPIDIEIYPNPTNSGIITIKSQSAINAVHLIDLQGNYFSLKYSSLNDHYIVSLDDFSQGIYMLSISFEGSNKVRQRISLMEH